MLIDWLVSLRRRLRPVTKRSHRIGTQWRDRLRTRAIAHIETLEPRYFLSAVTAVGDSYQVQERAMMSSPTPIVFSVLNNDSSTGGAMTITSVQTPAHGTVSIQHDPMAAMYAMYGMPAAPDTLVFTAPTDFSGVESFTYHVVNAAGDQADATVTLTITSVLQVTSLSTNSGSSAGGTSVTISGSGFTTATQVLFGDAPASSFTVNSDTSITAVAPAHASGSVSVQVTTPTGSSGMSMYGQFNYVAAPPQSTTPTITSLTPGTAGISGGDSITITGSGFTNVMSVTFGGSAASSYMVMSDTTIHAVAPAHSAGPVDVRIMTMAGTSAITSGDVVQYTAPAQQPPAITSLSVGSGSASGGTSVGIQGTGFANVTAVWFGGLQATSFVVNSPTSITAVAPAHAAGNVNIQIVTSAGSSSTSMASQFTYVAAQAAPTVTQVAPGTESISGGDVITITGTGFSNVSAVTFGGTPATSFTVVSATTITAVAPSHGAGQAAIQVTTSAGTSSASAASQLSYLNSNTGGSGNSSLTDWQAAQAQSLATYQQSLNAAKALYTQRLQEITNATNAAQAARDAADAALKAESATRLNGVIQTVQSALDTAAATRDQQLDSLAATLASQSSTTDATYAQQTQAASDEVAATLQAADQQFNTSLAAINDHFTSVSTTAQSTLDSQLGNINAASQTAVNAAFAASDAASAAALATYQSASSSAFNTYQSSAQAQVDNYNQAVATANASLTASLSGGGGGTAVTTNFDDGVIGANSAYQAQLAAARAAFNTSIAGVVATYNAAMAAADTAYSTAINTANSNFADALQAASDTYTSDTNDAFDAYNDSVDDAVATFDGQVAQLQTDFDTTTNDAADAYQDAIDDANSIYDQAIADAQSAYDTTVGPAQTTYNNYRATAPGNLNAAIIAAAKTWVTGIKTAEQAYPGAINGANTAHANALEDAIEALADMGASGINTAASTAMQHVQGVANQAKDVFLNAISAPLNIQMSSPPTVADMNAYTLAFQTRQNNAVLAYLDTVVGDLVDQAGTLRTTYSSDLDSTWDPVKSAVEGTGTADVTWATDTTKAAMAIQKAKEAGQAKFMQALADLEDAFYEASENAEIAYRKVLTTAQDTQITANAAAAKAQSNAYGRAGVTYVTAVAEAQKTYVDGYFEDWDTMETAFDTAAEQLTHDVADADEAYVDGVDAADQQWVTGVESAATSFDTAADSAATSADSGLHSAVDAFESAAESAWASAVHAAYPNATDATAYINAKIAYTNSIVSAWEAADTARVSLANTAADQETQAANAELSASASAAHTAEKAAVDAQTQAMIAATDARRDFDTSYVDAAKQKAEDTVAQTTQQAENTVTARKREAEQKAQAYLDAITQADSTHKNTVLAADDDIKSAADGFLAASFAEAKQLQAEAEADANQAADDATAQATSDATDLKGRLVAHTNSEVAKRKADALKAYDDAITNIQKQLSDLHTGPTSNLNNYQMTASNGTIPFMSPAMLVMGLDSVRSNLKQIATNILSNLDMAGMMMGSGALINTVPGASASELMIQFLGMSGGRTQLVASNGVLAGSYDVLADAVYRSVPQSDGTIKQGVRSKSDVDAALNSNMTSDQWNQFFGGSNAPPDPKSFMHQAINIFIDDSKLQAPGGLGSDIMLTAQLVTEITGTLDPTPLSDGINGSISLAQGDNAAAALSFGSILVPFGAEKIAKAASRVPVGAVDNAVHSVETMASTTSRQIGKSNQVIADATSAQRISLDKVGCTGITCFVAGTQVLTNLEAEMTAANEPDPVDNAGQDLDQPINPVLLATAAGLVAATIKSRTKPGEESTREKVPTRRKAQLARAPQRSDIDGNDDEYLTSIPEDLELEPGARVDVWTGPQLEQPPRDDGAAPERSTDTPRGWMHNGLSVAMLLFFSVAGWLWTQNPGHPPGAALGHDQEARQSVANVSKRAQQSHFTTQSIEQIRPGQRVVGHNPIREQVQEPADINSEQHQLVRFEMDQDGVHHYLEFIRSVPWIEAQHAVAGSTVHLSLAEMGLDGEARVVAIERCPDIERDDGRSRMLVTGTMHHLASNVLQLEVAGQAEPLGVTDTHPMWSVDREQFVAAGQLQVGEQLIDAKGSAVRITRITPHRGPPVMVYNLEVDGEHVYHVGADGLLVHNACGDVLLDTNVVFDKKKIDALVSNGQTPKIPAAVQVEIDMLDRAGRMKPPKYLDQLAPSGAAKPSIDTIINVRGKMQEIANRTGKKIKGNMIGDGQIGAEALETGVPLITNDKLLKQAVNELGGVAQ